MRRTALMVLGGYAALKVCMAYGYHADIRDIVTSLKSQYSAVSGVPTSLVMAIIKQESDFDVNAVGGSGEYGLMQVMPETYSWIYDQYGLGCPLDPYDPGANILAGMLFLAWLYDNTGSWSVTIHAYNVGLYGYYAGSRNWGYFANVALYWLVL